MSVEEMKARDLLRADANRLLGNLFVFSVGISVEYPDGKGYPDELKIAAESAEDAMREALYMIRNDHTSEGIKTIDFVKKEYKLDRVVIGL